MLNPVTSSCIRPETSYYDWEGAKASCEAQGENLAVFTTEESLAWIRDFIRNQAPAGIHYERPMKQLTLSIIFYRYYYANMSSYVLKTKNAISYFFTYKIEAQ